MKAQACEGRWSPFANRRWHSLLLAAALIVPVAACSSSGGSTAKAAGGQASSGAAAAGAGASSSDIGTGQSSGPASSAAATADFYRGKTITLIVSGSAGGAMDVSARIVAPALQKAVGASAVKVVDVHGAGGVTGFNQIWEAPKDGYTIGYGSMTTLITTALVKSKSVKYDAGKFVYLGRAGLLTPQLISASAKSKIGNVAALQAYPKVLFSAQGFDDGFFTTAAVIKTLGLNAKFVTGFTDAAAEKEAVSNGTTTAFESSLAEADSLLKGKLVTPILMLNDTPVKGFENVPLWVNSVSAEMKPVAQAFQSVLDMGRSLVGPPGFPPEAATALTAGLATALQSPDVLSQMTKLNVGVSYLSASDEQAAVQKLLVVLEPNVSMMTQAMQQVQNNG